MHWRGSGFGVPFYFSGLIAGMVGGMLLDF
jgi:hypothetical protein